MSEINSIKVYIKCWNMYFDKSKRDILDSVPSCVKEKDNFASDVFPEPYYGDLAANHPNDTLLLLINPGSVDALKTKKRELLNDAIKKRYLQMSFEEGKKTVNEAGRIWREKKLKQLNKVRKALELADQSFLYTLEYFPFHSNSWKATASFCKSYEKTPFMQSTISALKEIIREKRFRCVLGVGKVWVSILKSAGFREFELPQKFCKKNKGTKRYSYQFFAFKSAAKDRIPIVIYSSCSMNLPVNKENLGKYIEILNGIESRTFPLK